MHLLVRASKLNDSLASSRSSVVDLNLRTCNCSNLIHFATLTANNIPCFLNRNAELRSLYSYSLLALWLLLALGLLANRFLFNRLLWYTVVRILIFIDSRSTVAVRVGLLLDHGISSLSSLLRYLLDSCLRKLLSRLLLNLHCLLLNLSRLWLLDLLNWLLLHHTRLSLDNELRLLLHLRLLHLGLLHQYSLLLHRYHLGLYWNTLLVNVLNLGLLHHGCLLHENLLRSL
mmetsp:Transcript_5910/g.7294  ORF Transcript_5910/g.7294 Transcript_5910/m.7294 type:complete len:230 (-) Transcript_5910:1518-2207(-)